MEFKGKGGQLDAPSRRPGLEETGNVSVNTSLSVIIQGADFGTTLVSEKFPTISYKLTANGIILSEKACRWIWEEWLNPFSEDGVFIITR